MKKSLLNLAFGGLAVLSMASMVNAQTLTLDWKYTEDIPTSAGARSATGFQGKLWTNDKDAKQLIYWDEEGKHVVTGAEGASLAGSGTAITFDNAGNLIMNGGFPNAASSTTFQILPAGGDALIDLNVTLPEGVAAGRMDIMGRAIGNVMSEDGGAFYIVPTGGTKIAKVFVANGAQVAEKTEASAQTIAVGSIAAADNLTYVQPLDNDVNGWNVAWRVRTGKDFCYWQNGETKVYSNAGASTTAGGDIVVLNGVTYTFEPMGTAYADGFQVVDRSTNTVVATHETECDAVSTAVNSLIVEKVDEYTANVYHMFPSKMVAKYTFSLPKPLPKLEVRNAYAYDITVATAEGKATVNYRLNAPASAVMVQLWNGSELVKEVEGTTIAEYGDYEMTTVNNLNTVVMDIADVTAPGNYSYKVKVSSDVVSAPTAVGPVYRFWSPYGIAVDNNPDSPYFGRVLVTETQTSLPDKTYHSAPSLGGIGIGIYAFDQMLQPIENAQGTHGFTAGMEMSTGKYPNGTSAIYDPKRIHISDDGRIFLSRVTTNASSLWEINPDDLNAPATEIFKGTLGTEGYVTDAEGNFVAGPATAMDVWGEGENLKVAIVSCKDGYALDPKAHRVDVYNLGTAKEWSSKPSQELASISNKYWINSAVVNMAFDADGKGLTVGQYRANPNDNEPAYKHVNLETGEVDYTDLTTVAGGAGMAWNADHTLFAMVSGKGIIGIFEVTKDESGVPTFNKKYEFNTGFGTNINAIAWDAANNLFTCSNSGEEFGQFAMPRENGDVTVAAASKYNFKIEADVPENLYLIGMVNGLNWDPTQGELMTNEGDGVFTTQIIDAAVGATFGFSSVLAENNDGGGWDYVNANRYGAVADNTPVVIGEENAIYQNAFAFNLPKSGTYNLTVDLVNMNMFVEYVEPENPETLYLFGTISETDQWVPTTNVELTNDGNDVYTAEDVVIYKSSDEGETYGYIAFTATPSEDWNVVNATRYGPVVGNTELVNEVATEIGRNGDTSYKIIPGTYDFTVDLNANTVTVVEKGSGVEQVINAVAVIGGNGNIRIVGEAQSVSVYNVNGQAVVLNSAERSFDVAAGIYVVVVDGKTTKVMVK